MSGYTKGPWSISQRASTAVMDGGGVLVATCGGYQSNMVDPCELLAEQEANARLIAAAPCLLEALEMLLDDHRRIDPHHEHLCPLCVAASAAIAKAKS